MRCMSEDLTMDLHKAAFFLVVVICTASRPTNADPELYCYTGRGAGYRGPIAVTESGKTCQSWSAQTPHQHSRTPENNPRSGLEHNYCRNPDNKLRPWCYTTDSGSRWEYCAVRSCTGFTPPAIVQDLTCFFDSGTTYRGTVAVTDTGKTCQSWSSQTPHEHDLTPENYPSDGLEHNYCRNPDQDWRPWCYTTDPESDLEYCPIPRCNDLICYTGRGTEYRGTVAVTMSGKRCQRWTAQTPHGHSYTPENYPSSGLENNYCRNPDNQLGPWCFTTDSGSRWEFCDVPNCASLEPPPEVDCFTARGAAYRGTISVTESGKTCQKWSAQTPHEHDCTPEKYPRSGLQHNYCRNPDNDMRPWCFTTDSGSRTEYCGVPRCTDSKPPPIVSDMTCYSGVGIAYRGTVAVTKSGKTCQRWSEQTPHRHSHTPENYPVNGLEHNYCRNPDNKERPWCYTTDSGSPWEYCGVPKCTDLTCFTGRGTEYRGTVAVTVSGKTCQSWSVQTPHGHSYTPENYPSSGLENNYCRNPDNQLGPWCFTTDSGSRWDYCNVPNCASLEPPPEVDCFTGRGAAYRGTISVTASGKTCQKWSAQTPHEHSRTPENYPRSGLQHNYCRNPDNIKRPWCYTTDSGTRREYCGVPRCTASKPPTIIPEMTCYSGIGISYRGTVAVTESGKTCQRWSDQTPHQHRHTPENYPVNGLQHNYCRNPDDKERPWCYTTDSGSRWEYCGVPQCTDLTCFTGGGSEYRGMVAVTVSGKKCQSWSVQLPHGHSYTPENYPSSGLENNYCRNPGNEAKPWCYTTDPDTSWDYCDIPKCSAVPAFSCGTPVIDQTECLYRIVGGCESSPHSWPWQISLRKRPIGHWCGGTLIDPQWVLTAAHCLHSSTPNSAYSVYLGIHTQEGSESSKQERRLEKLVLGPNGADIALLKLESPVSINSEVRPACLPDKDYVVPHGTKCYATGWGVTQGTGGEGRLNQANVPVIKNEICKKAEYLGGEVKDYEMCAGYDEGGVDSCQGDSGGPLVTYAQNRYVLQGVTSRGHGCANPMKPGIYTRVSKFIDWIKRTINAG